MLKTEEKIEIRRLKERVVTLRLDEPTYVWLKEIAEQNGLGVSPLIRMWVLKRLSEENTPSTGEWSEPYSADID